MSDRAVFVPPLKNRQSAFVLGRTYFYLRRMLASQGYETTSDIKSEFAVAHLFSVRQVLEYEGLLADLKRPYFVHAFSFFDDYEPGENLSIELKKDTVRAYNGAAGIIVYWPSQKILLRHLGITAPIEVVRPVGEDYTSLDPITRSAFRSSYAIPADRVAVSNLGVYNPDNGFDEYEDLARIMPDLDFYFFGLRTTLFNSSSHYSQSKSNRNLFYEDIVPSELYPSLIASISALVLTGSFHIESILLADVLKSRVPVISNKNPVLYDLLIADKTSLIATTTEQFYLALHDIEEHNYAEEAYRYISQYTYESEGAVLVDFYRSMLSRF